MGSVETDQTAAQGTAIIARNASKLFLDGTVVAFRQLTLSVRHQEILCIVGPSGCGKTTFLRAIAGLIDLSSGDLLVGGKPGRGPTAGVAAKIAGAPSAVIKERVEHYLDLSGLSGFEHH